MESIANKIKKLLALSQSPNEAEAIAASQKAQELLTRHNLSMADLADSSQEDVEQYEVSSQRFLEWGQRRTVDRDDWIDQAIALFGSNHLDWRFKCPKCGQSQSIGECHKWGMTGLQPMQLCGNCGHCIPPINPVVIESKVRNHYERTYVFEFDRKE